MRTHARARARMYSEPYERSYLLAACGTDSQAGPRGRPGSEPESGVSPEPEIGRITRIPIARAPLPPPSLPVRTHARWTKLERQVRQSGALPARYTGHSSDYYCRPASFPPRLRALVHVAAFCLYERTHARTSAPVLTARAADSRRHQRARASVRRGPTMTERNKFRCARRGRLRGLALVMTTVDRAVFLVAS